MPLETGARLGYYEILSLLGAGGMGEVYRARDTRLNRDVAVKILPAAFANDADRMARFAREAQLLAALNHPNIAAIYGLEEGALVMELVEGATLSGPMPLKDALGIAGQIVEALEYAHEKGIIHRDLKPANIKITPEGRVKILDFGLAKALGNESVSGDPASSPTLTMRATMSGVILGTAAYMSPEQARGGNVGKQADIWSFGVVLYEMLTGRQSFAGETVSDTLAAVLKIDPDWSALPAETPTPIRRLLQRCLERDRKRRMRDIGDAQLEIEEALAGPPEVVAAPTATGRRGVSRWWVATAAVLALAGLAVSIAHFREAQSERQVFRYTLALPEGFALESLAVSPDGHYVVVAGAGDRAALWLRPLDSLQGQMLAGTEGATFPFWSGDSRHIGFFMAGKLKRIAVSGGPAQTLCDAPLGRGGTWNREGLIVFAPGNSAGLSRVPAVGGVPASVIAARTGTDRFPTFLPDGRRFLYSHLAPGPEQGAGIFLASPDSKEMHRLMPDSSSAGYSPPAPDSPYGHLLFLREDTLMAQPLDPKNMLPAGELFPVAEQVSSGLNSGTYGKFGVSKNGVLIYQARQAAGGQQLTWFDRSGKRISVIGKVSRTLGFGLSPDGKQVLIEHPTGGTLAGDLWMMDVERGGESRFSSQASVINRSPVWSPDGSRVIFTSNRDGHWGLYQRQANGAGQDQLLVQSNSPLFTSDWTRDGKFVIYSSLEPKSGSDLWAVPLSGDSRPISLLQSEFAEFNGQVSPDSRWLAYVSNADGRPEIYVQPFAPGAGKGAAGKWHISTAGGSQPRWRGDGKELFYVSPERNLMAVDVKSAGDAFEHGAPHALFASPFVFGGAGTFSYVPSSDGKRFLEKVEPEQRNEAPPLTVVVNWQSASKR